MITLTLKPAEFQKISYLNVYQGYNVIYIYIYILYIYIILGPNLKPKIAYQKI